MVNIWKGFPLEAKKSKLCVMEGGPYRAGRETCCRSTFSERGENSTAHIAEANPEEGKGGGIRSLRRRSNLKHAFDINSLGGIPEFIST